MITSITVLSHFDNNPEQPKCYTFVTGFIAIGIFVEFIILPIITAGLLILEKNKKTAANKG